MFSRIFSTFWMFVVPLGISCLALVLKAVSGPYWHHFDPCYTYLLNGLNIATGKPAVFGAHPGTPLELLCSAVIYILNLTRTPSEIVDHVLTNPEFYLNTTHTVLITCFLITSITLSWFIYQKTHSKTATLLLQLSALGTLPVKSFSIPVWANVSPELVMISVINLLNICLLRIAFSSHPRREWRTSLWIGFLCATGLSAKYSFFPLLLLPIIVLSWKQKAIFLGTFLLSFLVWMIPLLHSYQNTLNWAISNATHTGHYGSGDIGFINLLSYIKNIRTIVQEFWPTLLLVSSGLLWSLSRQGYAKIKTPVFFFRAASLIVLIHFLLIARHFCPHYAIPGLYMAGFIFLLFYLIHPPRSRGVIKTFLAIWIVLNTALTGSLILTQSRIIDQTETFLKELKEQYPGALIIPSYQQPALEQTYALSFSNDGSNKEHLPALTRKHPVLIIYDPVEYIIWNHTNRIAADDLISKVPCIIFAGPSIDFSQGPHKAELIKHQGDFYAYRLTASTEKTAHLFFLKASQALLNGNQREAAFFASQSLNMGFRPQAKAKKILDDAGIKYPR